MFSLTYFENILLPKFRFMTFCSIKAWFDENVTSSKQVCMEFLVSVFRDVSFGY